LKIKEAILEVVKTRAIDKTTICMSALDLLYENNNRIQYDSVTKEFNKLVRDNQIVKSSIDNLYYLVDDQFDLLEESRQSIIVVPNTETRFCQFTVGQVFIDSDDSDSLCYELYDGDFTKNQYIIAIVDDTTNKCITLNECNHIRTHLEYHVFYSPKVILSIIHRGHSVSVRSYLPLEFNPSLPEIHKLVRIRPIHIKQLRALIGQ
jgi:hypothetical protein